MRTALLLVAVLALTACSEEQPRAERPAEPVSPEATATLVEIDAAPTDHELGEALPARSDVGVHGFRSCVSGVDVCADHAGVSWVRAGDGEEAGRENPAARWAEITVGRPGESVRSILRMARFLCEDGDFVLPPDGRGFDPRTETWRGTGREQRVERAGFRGVQCTTVMGPVGGVRNDWHSIRAVRDDVSIEVVAHSGPLASRLFEEYVDRLDWPLG